MKQIQKLWIVYRDTYRCTWLHDFKVHRICVTQKQCRIYLNDNLTTTYCNSARVLFRYTIWKLSHFDSNDFQNTTVYIQKLKGVENLYKTIVQDAFSWCRSTQKPLSYTYLRAVEWVHSVMISRGEVTVNETSPTSARYIDPILHASLHVFCMDRNSIEQMRWVPQLDMIYRCPFHFHLL